MNDDDETDYLHSGSRLVKVIFRERERFAPAPGQETKTRAPHYINRGIEAFCRIAFLINKVPTVRFRRNRSLQHDAAQERGDRTAAGVLGECLTLLKRYDEAERALNENYAAYQSRGGECPGKIEARRRLVKLYEAWGKPEQAARFRG